MRLVLAIALLGGHARAEPEASVQEDATRDGVRATIDTSLRMRSEGAAVGVGVGTRLVQGDYALSLGLTRWQTIDDNGSRGSWEVALGAYRYLQLGDRIRAHVMAGASYELVERVDGSLGRAGVKVGVGVSWRSNGHTAWAELSLENKHWVDMPEGVTDPNELTLMLMLGFTF